MNGNHRLHDTRPRPTTDAPVPPPSKLGFTAMVWVCVFPTLTALNLGLGSWLATLTPVLRTFVLASIAVPFVTYAVMPRVQRARALLIRALRAS